MAVRGVGIERDIGDQAEIGKFFLDRAERAADEIIRVQRFRAGFVAQLFRRVREQRDRGNFQLHRALGFAHGLIDREALDAGHACHRLAVILALADKERPDQVVGGEHVFPDQAARPFGLPVAAHAGRKLEAVRLARGRAFQRDDAGLWAGFAGNRRHGWLLSGCSSLFYPVMAGPPNACRRYR